MFKHIKRMIAVILAVVMMINSVPMDAFASGTVREEAVEEVQTVIEDDMENDSIEENNILSQEIEEENNVEFLVEEIIADRTENIETLESEHSDEENGISWEYTNEKLVISGNGVINNNAFANDKSIKIVEIQEGITGIGQYAFSGCSGLEKIEIPNTVTVIDKGAFAGCERLSSVKLPSNLQELNGRAFGQCTSLTSISIPASLTTINAEWDGREH